MAKVKERQPTVKEAAEAQAAALRIVAGMMRTQADTLTGPRQQADRIRIAGWADTLDGIAQTLIGAVNAEHRGMFGKAWQLIVPAVTVVIGVGGVVADGVSLYDHFAGTKTEEAAQQCIELAEEHTPMVYGWVTGREWPTNRDGKQGTRIGGIGKGLDALIPSAGTEGWPTGSWPRVTSTSASGTASRGSGRAGASQRTGEQMQAEARADLAKRIDGLEAGLDAMRGYLASQTKDPGRTVAEEQRMRAEVQEKVGQDQAEVDALRRELDQMDGRRS